MVSALSFTHVTYTGSAITAPTFTVSDGSILQSTDYTVTGNGAQTNAGTYTITITGQNNYTGTITRQWTIDKAAGSITLNKYSDQVPYGTGNNGFKVTARSGDGALTASTSHATATVTPAQPTVNGDITIQGISTLAAGSTVVVTVTVAESANFLEASVDYTLTIGKRTITGTVNITTVEKELCF